MKGRDGLDGLKRQVGQGRIRTGSGQARTYNLLLARRHEGGVLYNSILERRSRIPGSSGPRTGGIIDRGCVDVVSWLEGADVFPWCLV